MTDLALARQLYDYAVAHYEDGGWDVIVECFSIDEIAAQLAEDGATDLPAAIASFATQVDVWADREADARNSAF